MNITSIGTSYTPLKSSQNFGAQIFKTNEGSGIDTILYEAQRYDRPKEKPVDYKYLNEQINKILPKESDEVIFKNLIHRYHTVYTVEGEVKHNGKVSPFSTTFNYYKLGSNGVVRDIVATIEDTLENS